MCSHYQELKEQDRLMRHFGVNFDLRLLEFDMWPRYKGLFIRRPIEADSGDEAVPEIEPVVGMWSLVSGLAKTYNPKLSTFNARSETASKLFTFANAWKKAQHCIIPAEAIFEPDWRSGKSVPTRFTRVDGKPLGIAGLWDRFKSPTGEIMETYTMLTINADNDPLFQNYHQQGKEKRMVVMLPEGAYSDWLKAPVEDTWDFLLPFPSDKLNAQPIIKTEKKQLEL